MKKVIIAIIIVVLLVPVVIFFGFPGILVNMSTGKARKAAGLVPKTVQVGNNTVAYLEGGSGVTVVLVHGLGGNKDNWPAFAKSLTGEFRVIALDMPGSGGSTKNPTDIYSISAQADRLNAIVTALDIKKAHILGHGMGGTIAGRYAAKYHAGVLSLCLMDAEGIPSPVPSEFDKYMVKGENPLAVKTTADVDTMLNFLFVTPPSMPGPVKRFVRDQSIAASDFNQKIYFDVFGEEYSLVRDLPLIRARTLLVWGDTDRKVHTSVMKVFEVGIRDASSVIIEKSGHFPMREKPEETAKYYIEFLKKA